MDEATRKQLLGNVDASGKPLWESARLSDLVDLQADGLEGVRRLRAEDWAPPIAPEQSEDEERTIQPTVEHGEKVRGRALVRILLTALGVFAMAALPRLFVLFFVTDLDNPGVGWYNDSFHHWQIGYLSKEIGFSQGFLRLWDFKGMEYFWGLLHPLVLAALFTATGSIDILIPRLLSLVLSSVSIAMLFFLIRRFYTIHVALAGVLLAVVNPVAIFADTAGLQEPLGVSLLLLGLLLWPRHSAWAGLAWGLAGMARAEYWLFAAGLVAISLLAREPSERRIALAVGWLLTTLVYMKYLIDKTGNPIYPLYWNFRGDAVGEWVGASGAVTSGEIAAQWIARGVFALAGSVAIWITWRRRKSYQFLLLGIGNIMFMSLMWGFTAYIHAISIRALHDRFLVVPQVFIGVFLSILLLHELPKLAERESLRFFGWATVIVIGVLAQLSWGPILEYYDSGKSSWANAKLFAEEVAAHYQGGSIAVPEDQQGLVYLLARYHGITAQNLQSQMYDPFYYFEAEDLFANWTESRGVIADWFRRSDIRMIVFYSGKETYQEVIRREPQMFNHLGSAFGGVFEIYEVRVP